MATGQPFLINGTSKLACIWFGDNERAIAIGIVSFGLAIGTIIGLSMASFFIFDDDKNNHAKIRKETENFMLWVSWGTTALCLPMIIFYKQRPRYFPSRSAEEDATGDKIQNINQMISELSTLFKNKNFVSILIIFSIMDGSYTSLGTNINFLFEPFGYSSTDTSILGALFVVTGLVSSIMFPILIDKYQWFLRSLKIITIGAFISSLIILGAIPSKVFGFALLSIASLGFFVIPTMSIVYAFATELTYPCSEALFGSLLQAGSGIFGTVVAYAITFMINKFGSFSALVTYALFFFICGILSHLIKEDLRRLNLKSDANPDDLRTSNVQAIQNNSAQTSGTTTVSLSPEQIKEL